MGPLEIIDKIPPAMLGPLETVGATLVKNDGPIGDHRPNIPPATLGPSEAVGSIPCEECRAHSRHWYGHLPIVLGPFETVGVTRLRSPGPIGDHRQNSTGNAGPIRDHRRYNREE
jgi:hypothetical protein